MTRTKKHYRTKRKRHSRRRRRGGNGLSALIATPQLVKIADVILIKWYSMGEFRSRIHHLNNIQLKKLAKLIGKKIVEEMGGIAGANARYKKILMTPHYLNLLSIKAIIQKLGKNKTLARAFLAKVERGRSGDGGGADGGTGVLDIHMVDTDPTALQAQFDLLDMPAVPTAAPVAQQQRQKQAEAARKVAIAISAAPHQNGGRRYRKKRHRTRKKRKRRKRKTRRRRK